MADNDSRELDLNPTAVTVREEDANGVAYTVALKTEPKEAVTVTVEGAAGTDLVLGRTVTMINGPAHPHALARP